MSITTSIITTTIKRAKKSISLIKYSSLFTKKLTFARKNSLFIFLLGKEKIKQTKKISIIAKIIRTRSHIIQFLREPSRNIVISRIWVVAIFLIKLRISLISFKIIIVVCKILWLSIQITREDHILTEILKVPLNCKSLRVIEAIRIT